MTESTLARPITIDMYYVMYQLNIYFVHYGFSDLEKQILKLYYEERKSLSEIGENLSLDKYEVGTIYHDCMRRLGQKAGVAREEYFLLKTVQDENKLLKRKIADLRKLLEKDNTSQKTDNGSDILEKQFYELDKDFDLRTNNALRHAGINTLGDVILYSETDLLNLKNMGAKSLKWLKDYLEKMNLSLSKH